MATQIFVNLPVKDLERSMRFFRHLGFEFNPRFTDHSAACMVIASDIYAMLLTVPKFRQFTNKEVADAHRTTEVLTCLSIDSRERVDALIGRAVEAGGSEVREPMDFGVMYGRSISDLDGHIWEFIWMNVSEAPAAGANTAETREPE